MKTKTKDHFRNSKCLHVHDRDNFPQVAELASENGQLKEELLETQQMLTELRIKNQRLEKQASLSYFLIGQTIRWKQWSLTWFQSNFLLTNLIGNLASRLRRRMKPCWTKMSLKDSRKRFDHHYWRNELGWKKKTVCFNAIAFRSSSLDMNPKLTRNL